MPLRKKFQCKLYFKQTLQSGWHIGPLAVFGMYFIISVYKRDKFGYHATYHIYPVTPNIQKNNQKKIRIHIASVQCSDFYIAFCDNISYQTLYFESVEGFFAVRFQLIKRRLFSSIDRINWLLDNEAKYPKINSRSIYTSFI